ncbi:MAG TPA: nuclear transport factor 2 family protein [Gemmatimonadaceae bacterium]|nr:nuclear transport factor 2 family protein [Gemmatimonadaceae bacterium]
MTTRDTVTAYFDGLRQKGDWASTLANDITFTSFTSPVRQIAGKDVFLQTTKRFYSMIVSVEVRGLVVDGARACALTRYELEPPGGTRFASDVAEVFVIENGKIKSFDIYFDSAPYPK